MRFFISSSPAAGGASEERNENLNFLFVRALPPACAGMAAGSEDKTRVQSGNLCFSKIRLLVHG